MHAAPDNYANFPSRYVQVAGDTAGPDATTLATGDAGGRQRCGVVQRTGNGYRLVVSHATLQVEPDDDRGCADFSW